MFWLSLILLFIVLSLLLSDGKDTRPGKEGDGDVNMIPRIIVAALLYKGLKNTKK